MKLTNQGLENRSEWIEKGYTLPEFDRAVMIEKTNENPQWIHFGAGNLFKAFQANAAQKLLNDGKMDRGILAVEGFDPDILGVNRSHDNLNLLAVLKADGTVDKVVIGAIADSVLMDTFHPLEWNRLKEIFAAPSLEMASFTITEKGYALRNAAGEFYPPVADDLKYGAAAPASYLGKVAALLAHRYENGAMPIAMVSMDNCSHNGEKLKDAIVTYAKAWSENGKTDPGFIDYILDENKVSFPWSMIDKITPRPDKEVEAMLMADGVEDLEPIRTPRGSFVAPFVNAEETEYLVIEDKFPNGRPPLEEADIIFTDRDTVNNVEKMKVTTCLNPLHTAMSIYGCLLGYTKISEEMKDEDIVSLIRTIGYKEGLPVVVNPGILDPKDFIDTVIEVRLPNPFMPDAPQRIATDTSQKLSVRFGETIKSYLKEGKDLSELKLIPVVFAGWLRYLMGIDDAGQRFDVSDDPLMPELLPVVWDIRLGDTVTKEQLLPILTNASIFGVDLEAIGMADTVVDLFNQLIAGPGAVRQVLHDTTSAGK